MFYKNELEFLCDTLKHCRVRSAVVSPNDPINTVMDSGLHEILNSPIDLRMSVQDFTGRIEANIMYKSHNEFGLRYIYFQLSGTPNQKILFIGPYLYEPITSEKLIKQNVKFGLSSTYRRYIDEYFLSIPVLAETDRIFAMIDIFCERLWDSHSFAIYDVDKQDKLSPSPINESAHNEVFGDILVNMRALEKRYNFENELMRSVSLGQLHREHLLLSAFTDKFFENRVPDAVRNVKNYGIIMNTLLRKAAEQGGVHPIYLDRVSSDFAAQIEQISSLSEGTALMMDMFRSYCRLVRRHSTQKYSPVVQKTILIIDSDLSADLSLHTLANHQNLSLGYLSNVFKKETGKTVTEYIRQKRMNHAIHLLSTTHLQVQTIALHCGIMDVQYFSKIFKKHTGKTPKEYREAISSNNLQQ